MGNNDSLPQPTPKINSSLEDSRAKPRYALEENLIYLRSIANDNYGDIKIMSIKGESDQNLYALKIFRVNDSKSMQRIYQEAIYRKDLTLDTVVKIKEVRYDEANLYCSDHFKVLVLLEYFELTLKDEIQRRKQKNLFFSEIELFNLIDCVLSALILFDQKGISHEDVSPRAIYLTPNHIFKLNDIHFLTEGLNAYKKFLMGAIDPNECYLSQELLDNLKHRSLVPENYNKQKSDVFSLGMTVMEAATLTTMKECYDFDEFRIKTEKIASYFEEIKLRFNLNFCELLKAMLEIEVTDRPDYKDLYTLLAQELEQIKGINDDNNIHSEREEKVVRAEPIILHNDGFEDLEGRIKLVLSKSGETKKRYINELENSKHGLIEDDFGELIAKREDFLTKSHLIRDSLMKERDKKNILEEENFFDSNKLYEIYLEEYKKLKALN